MPPPSSRISDVQAEQPRSASLELPEPRRKEVSAVFCQHPEIKAVLACTAKQLHLFLALESAPHFCA